MGLTAVNSSTGTNLTNFRNDLSGGIGVNGLLTVQALVLSPNDGKLLVVHTGRRIANQDRYGVGIIDTATNTLSPWKTNLWQDNLQFVGGIQRAYAGAISPNGQYFVVSSGSGGDRPPINDTAVAFPLNSTSDNVQPLWVSRLFDCVYSIAISETAVYLGGHFNYMESPTARDPWPGLDDVGYGRGQGLAGYGLGDEIVTREHIGAVDPATGKALEWSPGSNSFEGNKAMLVHPRGLITGGDATTQGGYNVGRVAFYDFGSVPAASPYDTTITNPIEGRVKKADEQFVIDGTATATSGVRRVQLELSDRTTGRYLQDDLVTWGAANTINVNLASPERDVDQLVVAADHLRQPSLKAQAKTFAVNGSSDATKAVKKFETFGLADETPTTSITGPNGVQTSTTFTVTGTAVDDVGVNSIRFTMRDANGRYIQDDGSADTAYNTFNGQPDVIGAASATWSYEITVPYESEWTMQATAVDTAGQADLRSSDRCLDRQLDRRRPVGGHLGARNDAAADRGLPADRGTGWSHHLRRLGHRRHPSGQRRDPAPEQHHPREARIGRHVEHRLDPRLVPGPAAQLDGQQLQLVLHDAVQPGAGHLLLHGACDRQRGHHDRLEQLRPPDGQRPGDRRHRSRHAAERHRHDHGSADPLDRPGRHRDRRPGRRLGRRDRP